jgi:polysaccharide biosynthesis protein PslE
VHEILHEKGNLQMAEKDTRNPYQSSTRYNTLRDWVAIGFRRRRLVIMTFCGVMLGVVLFTWFWVLRYHEATMQVLVEQTRTDPAVSTGQTAAVVSDALVTTDQMNSEMALLQGTDMLRSVVVTCGLDKSWSPSDIFLPSDPVRREAMKVAKQTKRLASALDVEVEKTADVIDVTYGRTGNPQTPACVLQDLSKLYLQKHLLLRRPAGTSSFFADKTDSYHKALVDSEARVASFGRDEGVVAPDVQRTLTATQVVNSTMSLHQAEQQIAADEHRIQDLEGQLKTTPARSSTAEQSNAASTLLQELRAALLAAEVKRTQLLLKYNASYPLVQESEQEIAQTKEAIVQAEKSQFVNQTTDRDPAFELLREDLIKTRADLASEKATAAALRNTIQSLQAAAVQLDEKTVRQTALVREAKANEASYLLYLSKREQERTSDALDLKSIANVAIAVPPVVPVLPAHSPIGVLAIGFLFAIFVSIGAAVVAEYLDPSFRTPAEVLEILNVPVLASIPRQAA